MNTKIAPKDRKPIMLKLTDDEHNQLATISKLTGRSMRDCVDDIIEEHIRECEKQGIIPRLG